MRFAHVRPPFLRDLTLRRGDLYFLPFNASVAPNGGDSARLELAQPACDVKKTRRTHRLAWQKRSVGAASGRRAGIAQWQSATLVRWRSWVQPPVPALVGIRHLAPVTRTELASGRSLMSGVEDT